MKLQDRVLSKGLRERLVLDDNLGTTAKQVVMVWACMIFYNKVHVMKSLHTFDTDFVGMSSAGLSQRCGWFDGFLECLLQGRLL